VSDRERGEHVVDRLEDLEDRCRDVVTHLRIVVHRQVTYRDQIAMPRGRVLLERSLQRRVHTAVAAVIGTHPPGVFAKFLDWSLTANSPGQEDRLEDSDVLQTAVQALTIERHHRVRRIADDDCLVLVMVRVGLDRDERATLVPLKVSHQRVGADELQGVWEVTSEPRDDLVWRSYKRELRRRCEEGAGE